MNSQRRLRNHMTFSSTDIAKCIYGNDNKKDARDGREQLKYSREEKDMVV